MSTYTSKALLIHPLQSNELVERIRMFAAKNGILLTLFSENEFLSEPGRCLDYSDHVVAICNDNNMSHYVDLAKTLNFSLGVVSTDPKNRINTWFHIPRKFEDAIAIAFKAEPKPIDVLRCNNEVVLGMMMLGETPFLDQRSKTYQRRADNLWSNLLYWFTLIRVSLKNLFIIKPFPITITTGKGKNISTAITGLVSIENDVNSAAAKLINTSLSVQDGQVSTILIAPKSIAAYLSFLITALRSKKRAVSKLPSSVSYIKSRELKISANKELAFYIDGKRRSDTEIELELYPQAAKINVSDEYTSRNASTQTKKDTMRLDNLPVNETRIAMIQSHLPFFTRAMEDDFRELFLRLRDNAKASNNYLIMMVLSVFIASFGLFLSSPAVIIGAMVIAPLMSPISSFAMAVLRRDMLLLKESSMTIAYGMLLALSTASLLALLIPIEKITSEIAGRLQPNLIDLGVAVASGAAGAYALARESDMKSMPGVAIAVALVPPLSVAGIGIGWWDWSVFSGAMLLFLTNLFGISIAASFTFLILGYSPIERAQKGLAVIALILLLISVPLSISFKDMYQHWQLERLVSEQVFEVNNKKLQLFNPRVSLRGNTVQLKVEGSSAKTITFEDMAALKSQLESLYDKDVSLELLPRLKL